MRVPRLLTVIFVFSFSSFAAESPFSGTWKLDFTKSKLIPALPQSAIVTIDANHDGMKYSEEITAGKKSAKVTIDAKFDGKEYPVALDFDPGSSSYRFSYRRANAHTLNGTGKKDGQIFIKFTLHVSKDGKVITSRSTWYQQGKPPAKAVAVYDKQ